MARQPGQRQSRGCSEQVPCIVPGPWVSQSSDIQGYHPKAFPGLKEKSKRGRNPPAPTH